MRIYIVYCIKVHEGRDSIRQCINPLEVQVHINCTWDCMRRAVRATLQNKLIKEFNMIYYKSSNIMHAMSGTECQNNYMDGPGSDTMK